MYQIDYADGRAAVVPDELAALRDIATRYVVPLADLMTDDSDGTAERTLVWLCKADAFGDPGANAIAAIRQI